MKQKPNEKYENLPSMSENFHGQLAAGVVTMRATVTVADDGPKKTCSTLAKVCDDVDNVSVEMMNAINQRRWHGTNEPIKCAV